MHSYVIDNQIVLDILIPRTEGFMDSLNLYRYISSHDITLFLSSSQLSNLEYVLYYEKKKINRDYTRKENNELLNSFYQRFKIIKTPSYIDFENKLYLQDSEDYMIELSAKAVDAEVITRDKKFLKSSEITITIDQFIKQKQSIKNEFKFLDLHKQYLSMNSEIDKAIDNIINKTAFIGGDYVKKFENEFATYQKSKYCIGVGNGTDALEIAIEALALPEGSEIIVPANSFIASSESITRSRHKVVFCDCDKDNYTISIPSIKSKLTKQTKAIMAVHLYGHPCDMDAVLDIAKENDLKVIEDCAQAHGAEYKGKRVGDIGDIGTFSFYPGKNLGAYGDGGAIVTNNESLAKKCKMIANHGRIEKYNHEFEGRNSRLDGLQAAILSVKLKHLDQWTDARIKVANYYLENLKGVKGIVLPKREDWAKQVYHLFVIRTKKRDELQKFLKEYSIYSGVHYPISLPKLKAYDYTYQENEAFFANSIDRELLSLPIGEHLSTDDLEFIVGKLKQI
jgi:dTDP-4-amino-4,6-dideoxygalactose transaminase